MPHMDTGNHQVEYADHEVQVISARATLNEAGSIDKIAEYEPVYDDRGIDSNELAQLVAMYRSVSVYAQGNFSGFAEGEITLGANLSATELPTRASATGAGAEDITDSAIEVNTNASDASLFTNPFTDAGVFDATRQTLDGTSGSQAQERFLNFKENFGTGPFVDRTDDLSLGIEASSTSSVTDATVNVEVVFVLYWAVETVEGGRSELSRP